MSFVSHHVLRGIQVIWCTNTIIGEVAVEALQMKVQSDVSVQMILGHGIKVLQITYLTAPCRRARRDDQNGHLDHPIRSPDGKITPPGRSPTRPGQGRPARHLPQITLHSVSLHWGLTNRPPNTWTHAQSKVKVERPHMSLQWASEVATRRLG